eukprot:1117968-Pyramimonas_sp.AAC.1
MNEIQLIIIAPQLRRTTGEAGMARSRSRHDPDRGQVIIRVGSRDVQVQYGDARHSLNIDALMARELGSDNTALGTALTFVASLPAGRPAMTFGYVPAKKGTLQMTSASRLSSQ